MKKLVLAVSALLMAAGVAFAADDMSNQVGAMGNMKRMTVDECKTAMDACNGMDASKVQSCKDDLFKNNGCDKPAA